eukprot:351571-Chlamydomonas_euryale.AAC.5
MPKPLCAPPCRPPRYAVPRAPPADMRTPIALFHPQRCSFRARCTRRRDGRGPPGGQPGVSERVSSNRPISIFETSSTAKKTPAAAPWSSRHLRARPRAAAAAVATCARAFGAALR